MLAKEMWIHVPGAFPNGLDALEVRMDLPGRHPLVVLTHPIMACDSFVSEGKRPALHAYDPKVVGHPPHG